MATEAFTAPALVGHVVAVNRDSQNRFARPREREIRVRAGYGVRSDMNDGVRSNLRVGEAARKPSRVQKVTQRPIFSYVHLLQSEFLRELARKGFVIKPGYLGEHVTTIGIDLLALGQDTLVRIGPDVVLSVTGLRNPRGQKNTFRPGLLKHLSITMRERMIRKAGIMSIALQGGIIRAGDTISIEPPDGTYIPLDPN